MYLMRGHAAGVYFLLPRVVASVCVRSFSLIASLSCLLWGHLPISSSREDNSALAAAAAIVAQEWSLPARWGCAVLCARPSSRATPAFWPRSTPEPSRHPRREVSASFWLRISSMMFSIRCAVFLSSSRLRGQIDRERPLRLLFM